MNINKQFDQLFEQYNERASEILASHSTSGTTAENDPIKHQWAKQEGWQQEYDPNANEVMWTKKPEANYNVPDLMKFRGSMSPETMAENYPMFGLKTDKIDGLLQKIYQSVLGGEITQQRGEELIFQLMSDTYKEAKKLGKAKGAGVKSSSVQQTASKAMKGQNIVESDK